MQKIALALSIVALALGIYAVVSNGTTVEPESEKPAFYEGLEESTSTNDSDLKIAFVRGDSLNVKYQFILDKQDELISSSRQSENKLQRKMANAEKEYGELVGYIQSGQATEEEMQIAQQRMMELEYELQGIQQQEQERLLKKEADIQSEIVRRLDQFLDKYARENDIDLILNWGVSGEGVLYGSQPYDITDEVVNGLNEAYAMEITSQDTGE